MIFAITAITSGTGEPVYCLRVPFRLSPGRPLTLPNGPQSFPLGDRIAVLRKEPNQYAVHVTGFDSETSARSFAARFFAALPWVMLRRGVGVQFETGLGGVRLQDPITVFPQSDVARVAATKGWTEIDGQFDDTGPVVLPDHKRVLMWSTGQVWVRNGLPPAQFIEALAEGLALRNPERALADNDLRLALEVYASALFEISRRARFLSLVTVLEVLLPATAPHAVVIDAVRRYMDDVSDMLTHYGADTPEHRALTKLKSQLGILRRRSISERLRSLANDLPDEPAFSDKDAIGEEFIALYDLRGELVHEGHADLSDVERGEGRLAEVVPALLRSRYQQLAQ